VAGEGVKLGVPSPVGPLGTATAMMMKHGDGRTYGVHDGTLYPLSGPGFHQLSRGAFQALGVFNRFGNTPQAHTILERMKNVGPAEIEAALKAWSASR
jgi:hypothetical protein